MKEFVAVITVLAMVFTIAYGVVRYDVNQRVIAKPMTGTLNEYTRIYFEDAGFNKVRMIKQVVDVIHGGIVEEERVNRVMDYFEYLMEVDYYTRMETL